MSTDPQVTAQWARVCRRLKQEVGDTAFRAWLQPLTIQDVKDDEVQFLAPTRFMRDWVMTHYSERIRALWASEDARVRSVNLRVLPDRTDGESGSRILRRNGTDEDGADGSHSGERARLVISGADAATPCGAPHVASRHVAYHQNAPEVVTTAHSGGAAGEPVAERLEIAAAAKTVQATAGDDRDDEVGPLDARFTFDNFVVGKPNELAHAAARKVADAQAVTFNPLFLYSGVGLGKTHLMHAIAWAIRRKFPGRRVVYLSAERFMYQFIRALRFKDTVAFKEQYRSVDVLMIDDVQFISGKESTQEEFFHTFNALVDQNRQVVVSADKSPSDLDGMEERLKSRLGWGLVADIHPTTYELRLGVLHSKAEYLGVKVSSKVLEFLAHRITSNIRELEGALNRIIAHSELVGRPANIETTQELLRDLLRANDRRVSIDEIQRKVAEHFKVRFADMVSSRRARVVARPRQVAMYLSKQLTPRSLPEIGRKFGGRDHTTVLHAVRKVEELVGEDASFAEEVELLRKMLEG